MKEATGIKLDAGKPEVSFLPTEALHGAARVFAYGAKKYARDNWRGGMPYTRLYDAAQRHLASFLENEDLDPESGLPHLDHAICTLMMLRYMTVHRQDLDNRYKGNVVLVSEAEAQRNLETLKS